MVNGKFFVYKAGIRIGLLPLVFIMYIMSAQARDDESFSSAVYFKANGREPVWNLDIAEDQIVFNSSTPGFEHFLLPHAEPTRSENGQIKIYKVKSKEAEIEIQVIDQLCDLPNSRERFPFTVSLSIKRSNDKTPTIFSGCGLYVPDNRLHGRWTIESVKSVPIRDSLFKDQQPYLDLAVDGRYFTCFAGCNIINGRLYFERSLLRFTDLVTPKEPCDQDAIEKSVISSLQFTTQFSILRGELILGNPSETTMKLRKVK